MFINHSRSVIIDLDAYLKRLNFRGKLKTDRATLAALMKTQLLAVPFENLDVQLGVPVSTKPQDAFTKVVERGRGGWCFELNGLFRWALEEIGFEVQSLAGYVGRTLGEPPSKSSHLFLQVKCDEPFFVDVGFGGSQFSPMPIVPGRVEQSPYALSIEPADGPYFRWTEQSKAGSSSVDFKLDPIASDFFDQTSDWLQTAPESNFVRTLTAQRRYENRHVILRGLVKRTVSVGSVDEATINSSDQLVSCLLDDFGLDVPEIAGCWEKIVARHQEVLNEKANTG